jgi:hypothetical protein
MTIAKTNLHNLCEICNNSDRSRPNAIPTPGREHGDPQTRRSPLVRWLSGPLIARHFILVHSGLPSAAASIETV